MTFGSYEWYAMVEQTIDDLYAQELNRAPDVSGRANLMHLAREGGWTDQEMRAFLRNSDEWHALHDPKPEPELPTFTDAQLRTFSGNFCGIQIPGLPYKNPLFTPAYPIYDDVWRQVIREGCLSIPEYTGNVVRAWEVVVEGLDPDGQKVQVRAEDYEAVVFQHEIDHLDGILFLDRIANTKTDLFRRKPKR